jgi:hypothetical protein
MVTMKVGVNDASASRRVGRAGVKESRRHEQGERA